jgi:hypothetical protein
MEREVVDKLRRALDEQLSKKQVLYILSLVRTLIGHRKVHGYLFRSVGLQ